MEGIIGPTVAMANIIMVMSRAHFSMFKRGGWESVKTNAVKKHYKLDRNFLSSRSYLKVE